MTRRRSLCGIVGIVPVCDVSVGGVSVSGVSVGGVAVSVVSVGGVAVGCLSEVFAFTKCPMISSRNSLSCCPPISPLAYHHFQAV